MLYLDGVYAEDNYGKTRFHPIKAPTKSELNSLTHRLSQRVAGFLEREGLLVTDDDNDYLALDGLCQNSFSYHTLKSSTGLMSNKGESAGFVRVQVIPQP
jgi:hypothetical protein